MIISCPSCSARYAVDESKIGPRGRTVKCAKCGHTWTQSAPPPDEAATLPVREEPRPAPRAMREDAVSDSDVRDFRASLDAAVERDRRRMDESEEIGRKPSRRRRSDRSERSGVPAVRRGPSPWPARIAWLVLLGVIGGIVGGSIAMREQIVEAWPPAERLYQAVGLVPPPIEERLGVRNVKHGYGTGDDANVLSVQGEIVNISDSPSDVPDLRILFLNNGGEVLKRVTVAAPEKRMLPGESVTFRTRIPSPPAEAKHIDVGFDVERR
jgi:predicted Zn finger-like uncharacterized protein